MTVRMDTSAQPPAKSDTEAGTSAPAAQTLQIVEYDDALAAEFRDINLEWIKSMFHVEAVDHEVLDHPRARIIDAGGTILFVRAGARGIIGACALMPTGPDRAFELTKMGVREGARGLKAGEFLLHAVIQRALSLGADPLYLLTNARCAAAVHLYTKLGFRHDPEIMACYGAEYARCNVAMRYRGDAASGT